LLAGASVASVVLGLAAQSTLGNLVAGISLTIYRPFRLGDTLQVAAPAGPEVGVVEIISLGYTTLRTPSGHTIVVPNSIASSQVIVNMSTTFAPWPIAISIRLSRDADVDAARDLAIAVAGESAGAKSVVGCFLTKVDSAAMTLELRLVAKDALGRDAWKSKLLQHLSQRFAAAKIGGTTGDAPSFT
jgi:small conductance mechanosensitive channel